MSELPTTEHAGKAEHDRAAGMVMELYRSQLNNAHQLGRHAAGMGLRPDDNPFDHTEARTLRGCWMAGYAGLPVGNAG